ncbi:MAG: class I SAM-dependent methyltransferase [Bacteroidota bacterium]
MNTQLNEENRQMWESNADFWDQHMGWEGNRFHNELIAPSTIKLLELSAGDKLLDIGCGNGIFARKMAAKGIEVLAFDFSAQHIKNARSYPSEHIEYKVLDATDKTALLSLGENSFKGAVSNMVLMDIPVIKPMFEAVYELLKPGGAFVFSTIHPCFNLSTHTQVKEIKDVNGRLHEENFVKIGEYIRQSHTTGEAILEQPVPQYYFHRPIQDLFQLAFACGFVLDGFEEPVFSSKKEKFFQEIPLVIICRMRKMP